MTVQPEEMLTQPAVGAVQDAVAREGRLFGKVALVTGAAGNLGGHIVRHYLREGATVVLTGRERSRVAAARLEAIQATGVPEDRASIVKERLA